MKITEMALLILCGGKQRLSAQIYRITISCHIVIPFENSFAKMSNKKFYGYGPFILHSLVSDI
jgi:hypothetical protein